MSIATLVNRSCTLLQRSEGAEDDYGNPIKVDTSVETVVELQQRRSDEPDDQGELSDETWVAYFLPTESVNSGDGLVVDGETYEVVGDPWLARNPRTQAASHIEATLRRTAGPGDAS